MVCVWLAKAQGLFPEHRVNRTMVRRDMQRRGGRGRKDGRRGQEEVTSVVVLTDTVALAPSRFAEGRYECGAVAGGIETREHSQERE